MDTVLGSIPQRPGRELGWSWETPAPLPLAVSRREGLHSTDGDVGAQPLLAAPVPSELSSLLPDLCLHGFLEPRTGAPLSEQELGRTRWDAKFFPSAESHAAAEQTPHRLAPPGQQAVVCPPRPKHLPPPACRPSVPRAAELRWEHQRPWERAVSVVVTWIRI